VPTPVQGVSQVVQFDLFQTLGGNASAVTEYGVVWGWGYDRNGELGAPGGAGTYVVPPAVVAW
jgi:hypothetical protein